MIYYKGYSILCTQRGVCSDVTLYPAFHMIDTLPRAVSCGKCLYHDHCPRKKKQQYFPLSLPFIFALYSKNFYPGRFLNGIIWLYRHIPAYQIVTISYQMAGPTSALGRKKDFEPQLHHQSPTALTTSPTVHQPSWPTKHDSTSSSRSPSCRNWRRRIYSQR